MRSYEVTVTIKPKGKRHPRHHAHWIVLHYEFQSPFNIRAATVGIFAYFFGKHPGFFWAASGSLGMGEACDSKRLSKAHRTVEVHQVTLMDQAVSAAEEIIWKASQPRLPERRAA